MDDVLGQAMRDLGGQARLAQTPDELARSSWAAGRRRRLRSRLAAVGACLAVLGLLGLAVPLLQSAPVRPAATPSRTVPSYPQYIGTDRPSTVLPAAPGPIAGVLQDATEGDAVTYYAVTATGVRWRIPASEGSFPSLSSDGRLLLTSSSATGGLRVHDLVRGDIRSVPVESTPRSSPDEWVYWAPDDSTRVLSSSYRRLLDLRTGRVTRLPTNGITAGLVSGGRAVTLSWHAPRDRDMTDLQAHVVDLASGAVRDVRLQPRRPYVGLPVQQQGAIASPDGSTLAILTRPRYPIYNVDLYSLTTGRQLATRDVNNVLTGSPGLTWGKGLILPVNGGSSFTDGRTVQVTQNGNRTLVVAKHRRGSLTPTIRWASDAIAGTPHRTLPGAVAAWWSLWGTWALIVGAALFAAGGWFLIERAYRDMRS